MAANGNQPVSNGGLSRPIRVLRFLLVYGILLHVSLVWSDRLMCTILTRTSNSSTQPRIYPPGYSGNQPVGDGGPSRPIRVLRFLLVYGILLHVSLVWSDKLMCIILMHYLKLLHPASFWVLHGFLLLHVLGVNFLLMKLFTYLFFSGDQLSEDELMYNVDPRTTRSGKVYGYVST